MTPFAAWTTETRPVSPLAELPPAVRLRAHRLRSDPVVGSVSLTGRQRGPWP